MQEDKESNRRKLGADAHHTIRCVACIIGLVAVFAIASFTLPSIIAASPKDDVDTSVNSLENNPYRGGK